MFKKTLLILIFISFLIGGFCFAQRQLEIEYPTVPEVETPTTTKTALPEYLKYIFTLSIIIAGLLAFGALIYGGIRYLTSAGDPTKMGDARAQISAGVLGLIILLSSYLILNTINPQLVLPKKPPIKAAVGGIKIYTMEACQEDEEHPSFKIPPEGMKDLTDPDLNWGFDGRKIKSVEFLGDPGDLTANFWSDTEFKGTKTIVDYPAGDTEPCKTISPVSYKSISLDWHFPGVYLYANEGCDDGDYKVYQSSSATLSDFDNKTKSVKFIYGDENSDTGEYGAKYAVVLHEKENYMGDCVVAEPVENGDCINLSSLIKLNDPSNNKGVDLSYKVSSITVYLKPVGEPTGQGVKFWKDKNYLGDSAPYAPGVYYDGNATYDANMSEAPEAADFEDITTSLEIDGHYVAVLFKDRDYKEKCEVFMGSDPDLRSNSLGQCGFLGRFDCLSSFIVKARK